MYMIFYKINMNDIGKVKANLYDIDILFMLEFKFTCNEYNKDLMSKRR